MSVPDAPATPRSRGLAGVLGVVTPASDLKAIPEGATGLELRADLFPSLREALDCLERLSARWPVLFTLRLASQGGSWRDGDPARVPSFEEALRRGAALVDVEHGSEAARALARKSLPRVVSWHDFTGMPDAAELARRTRAMEAESPVAVKVVPSARALEDAVAMLRWVAARPRGAPARVGFAMGERGLASRVLSLARGAPWTYAALDEAVAPGQVRVEELAGLYRAAELGPEARVFGVIGKPVAHSLSPRMHNPALAALGFDAVYLPFLLESIEELEPAWDELRIGGLSVTIPFKEAALARADTADPRARAAGAANTLVVEPRRPGAPLRLAAFNTDVDGVLVPLAARLDALRGVPVAVLGNGGAARGAVRALLEGGARPTLFYRNVERGRPVAESLGVPSAHLASLRPGAYRVVINATPLGLEPGDPPPVPAEVLGPGTIAFDMAYGAEETAFLRGARERGAEAIDGREMLVAQGLVQFRLFTGGEADPEVFRRAVR